MQRRMRSPQRACSSRSWSCRWTPSEHGLRIARDAGVPTILNPAPAQPLPDALLELTDYLIPNESEAALLTGLPVESVEQAERAALSLLVRGARNVIVTLGAQGALICSAERSR